jgi:hypothetical protein
MLDQHKACRITKMNTLVLPAGRLSYPSLDKPRAMPGESEDKAKYSTSIILPADCDLRLAIELINKTASEKWPIASNKPIKKPFIKHAEKTEDAALAKAFPILIRAASNQKPNVLFASGDPCTLVEEMYPGRWALISVRTFAWDHPTGGRGVSFGLSNVMLLDHADRLGGGRVKAEDEFGDLFETGAPTTKGNGTASSDPDSIFN